MAGERGTEIRFNVVDTTNFEMFEFIFQEEMGPVMKVITEKVTGDAQRNAPVGVTGFYRGGIQPLISSPTGERPAIRGEVVATEPYSVILEGLDPEGNETEFGRKPGTFPNLGELRFWVERVINPPEKEIDPITFAIGMKIKREGLRPESRFKQPGRPIGDAFRAALDFINDAIQGGIGRILNRI